MDNLLLKLATICLSITFYQIITIIIYGLLNGIGFTGIDYRDVLLAVLMSDMIVGILRMSVPEVEG